MKRKECLETAIETVCKAREDAYGNPENNFQLISKLWSAYLGTPVTSEDVAMCMALLKVARIKTGKHKEDNYIDLCGYGACACELGHKEVKADELWSKEKWIQGKRHI